MTNYVETIVRKIAKQEGVDPLNLDEPLQKAIDVDALERALESGLSKAEFTYLGYRVTVTNNGSVTVTPPHVLN